MLRSWAHCARTSCSVRLAGEDSGASKCIIRTRRARCGGEGLDANDRPMRQFRASPLGCATRVPLHLCKHRRPEWATTRADLQPWLCVRGGGRCVVTGFQIGKQPDHRFPPGADRTPWIWLQVTGTVRFHRDRTRGPPIGKCFPNTVDALPEFGGAVLTRVVAAAAKRPVRALRCETRSQAQCASLEPAGRRKVPVAWPKQTTEIARANQINHSKQKLLTVSAGTPAA